MLRVRVCGGLEVEADGRKLPDALVGGRQGRLVFAYLVCERQRAVRREDLAELLWDDRLPESWPASLSAVISRLRRLLTEAGLDGAHVLVSAGSSYQLALPEDTVVDLDELVACVDRAEAAVAAGEFDEAARAAAVAESIAARGFLREDCDWVDQQREVVHNLRVRASLARAGAHLGSGAHHRAVEAAREVLALDESLEAAYRTLMRALVASGERGEALRVWERCRTTLIEELGVDPSAETEAVYLEALGTSPAAAPVPTALPSGVVTFLLTDIVESSALWERAPDAMAVALERHDRLVGEVVGAHGGTLLKSKLEGDATVSVFARASDGAVAALAVHEALTREPWPEEAVPLVRMALHTGEAFERGGDYFGPALNRAARLRSRAGGGQILLSQAASEVVRDHLPAGALLVDLGHLELRGLSRGEHVFELRGAGSATGPDDAVVSSAFVAPPLPAALTGAGPFVGRGDELAQLHEAWDGARRGATDAVFIGGEPGVGKSRLAAEIAGAAHGGGGLVVYGRCDEDLAAPLQPFIEAVRSLVAALGPTRLRAVRGINELRPFVPELDDLLPDPSAAVRADPDTERLALFDAITQLLVAASREAPLLLVLDDLHWAGKTTLSLLRHLLRDTTDVPVLVIGTYRDTELARTHPLAAALADLRRDNRARRIGLGGLAAEDVEAYLAAIGNTDRALGRELAEVTSGNPFFLIEVIRHVEESGGAWERGSLPEGVREATGRRLSRLSDTTNEALAVAAVAGASFDLSLVEKVCGRELVDEVAEAVHAGLVAEEAGVVAHFRFAHALVRKVLLAELVTVKRLRMHRAIAELLDAAPPSADPDARLADLAYHWFECAAMGGAGKAVEACRRAADRAIERLAYEEAADLYGMAIQALDVAETTDGELGAALHLARCDALLTAGDVAGARAAIDALELNANGSERIAAWYSTYEGLLAVLAEPDRLTEIVQSIGAAAGAMRAVNDLTGEAKAHYVHALALERLGQIGSAERALDAALAAARASGDRRLQDAILAEAPAAALWGPRPVTRASGTCLDVVRVLRITDGAPAVEAVALRCQAVLEALRGRTDAARKMIGSARRTVERLGLTHRRLETEVAAGYIELLDDEPAAAEVHLRHAYDELRTRGLDGEAAQAAAFLGRALLMQDRVDEADAVAAEAEALAGADLKAAIAWRDVRAEAAARQGDLARASTLAREAVELASATDALLLVADARLTLATVLRLAGDHEAADAEARSAVEACEAKGATTLANRARQALRAPGGAVVPVPASSSTSAPGFENDACRAESRVLAAYNEHDWDAWLQCYGPDWVQDDRRSLVRVPLDRDQSLAGARLIFDGGARFQRENLATRGRTLSVSRWVLSLPDDQVTYPVLLLTAIGEDQRYSHTTLFDADDVDGALAELDEMFLAGEGAEHASVLRVVASLVSALEVHDLEAVRALLDPACRVREVWTRLPDQSGHEWTTSLSVAWGLWGLGRARVLHVPRLSSTGAVWVVEGTVQPDDGTGPADARWIFAIRTDGELIQHLDFYSESDLEAALDDFDGVATLDGADHPFANEAWRAALRASDRCNHRDWHGLLAVLAPAFEILDKRAGVHLQSQGETALDTYRFIFGMDDFTWERELLATRDNGLALVRDLFNFASQDAGSAELSMLNIVVCDAEGRITANIAFGPDELRKAHDELDTQFVALGGPDLRVYREAFNTQDWTRFDRAFAPTYVVEDERASGYGNLDRDRFISAQDAWHDLAPGVEMWIDHVITRPPATLTVARYAGTQGGGTFERPIITVSTSDEAGRVLTARLFDIDQIDEARAAVDAIDGLATPANKAWRAIEAMGAAIRAHDWEAFEALFSPQFERHDDRNVLGRYTARDDVFAAWRALFELDDAGVDEILLATRGDRLALARLHVWFRSGAAGIAEVETLLLVQVDDTGLITHEVGFDIEDLDSVTEELDSRARAIEGDTHVPFPSAAWDAIQAMDVAANARAWSAFTRCLSPDYEVHDHRSVVGPVPPGEEAIHRYRMMFDLDEARSEHGLLATRGDRLALVRSYVCFRSRDAGLSEVSCLTVIQVDASGQISHEVAFDEDDVDAALDELDARYVALGGTDCMPSRRAFDARDWNAFAALYHPDCRLGDGRSAGFGWVDIQQFIEFEQSLVELSPDCRLWTDHVRSRGNVHFAFARTFGTRDGGPWELAMWVVSATDADGLCVAVETFELAELDAALARFEQLATEHSASRPNQAWESLLAATRAFERRDWDGFVRLHLPALVDDFRQRGTAHVFVGDDTFRSTRVMWDMAEARLDRRLIATEGQRVVLAETRVHGSDGVVGELEWIGLNVIEIAEDGRIARQTSFDLDDLERAHQHLRARAAALAPVPNAASRLVAAIDTAIARRDWEAVRGECADGFRVHDRRHLRARVFDERESMAYLRSAFDVPGVEWSRTVVATRADALALVRDDIRSSVDSGVTDYESSSLTLVELDPAGHALRHTVFDVDDLFAAITELDARAAALSPDPLAIPRNLAARSVGRDGWTLVSALSVRVCVHETPELLLVHEVDEHGAVVAEVTFDRQDRRGAADEATTRFHRSSGIPEPVASMTVPVNAHDVDASRAAMAEACTFEDHRAIRLSSFDTPVGWIESLEVALSLVPDYLVETLRVDAVRPWGQAVTTRVSGTTAEDVPFETWAISVSTWDEDGRGTSIHMFDPEDVAEAVAFLDSLAP